MISYSESGRSLTPQNPTLRNLLAKEHFDNLTVLASCFARSVELP